MTWDILDDNSHAKSLYSKFDYSSLSWINSTCLKAAQEALSTSTYTAAWKSVSCSFMNCLDTRMVLPYEFKNIVEIFAQDPFQTFKKH